MVQNQGINRLPGVTYAVSDTGPLISAFQSNSFELLGQIFAEIHISPVCVEELITHGWEESVNAASTKLVRVLLTSEEENEALQVAEKIANRANITSLAIIDHLGEAQAITLALRSDYRNDVLLLDELAARSVAKDFNINLSGFPGVLLLAVQGDLITAEELNRRLEMCRMQGTHYGAKFIQQVYRMAKQGRRQ